MQITIDTTKKVVTCDNSKSLKEFKQKAKELNLNLKEYDFIRLKSEKEIDEKYI